MIPWLLALLLAWLLMVQWLHNENRSQQQQQIQQLAITVNYAIQANLAVAPAETLASQLRQIHNSSPLAVQHITAYNAQRQFIASSTLPTEAPVLEGAPLAYQVSTLANGSQLAVLPVSAGLGRAGDTLTGQLPDNGYIAVVFDTEFAWLVWLMPLALLSGAWAVGMLLSFGLVKRSQQHHHTDIELVTHHLHRLQSAQQQCQISAQLVPTLRPVQQAFNDLVSALDNKQSAHEQLLLQLNQRLQQLSSQCNDLDQQRQHFSIQQQQQQRQIRHWFEQSLILWQRKEQLQPAQFQRLLQLHLLTGHYQFSAADFRGESLSLTHWLSQHLQQLGSVLPVAEVNLDWQEHPNTLNCAVNLCQQTLNSLLQALILLCLRAEDVSKMTLDIQFDTGGEQDYLQLTARCNGNGLPAHCRQLLQSADMLDFQWSDADIALLKAVQVSGATFSCQSLDGLGCILQLKVPVQTEPVSSPRLLQQLLLFDEDTERLQTHATALTGIVAQVTKCNSLSELELLINSNAFELVLLFLPVVAPPSEWQVLFAQLRRGPNVLSFAAPARLPDWQDIMPTVQANHQYCLAQVIAFAEIRPKHTGLQHILVVDDNETNLAFVQVLLKNKPLLLHTATSAAQVFTLCQQHKFDMILLDIQLPDMSGVDVARQLRQQPQYQKVPIVAFTAHAMPDEIACYHEAGMDDIIFKPLEPAKLDSLLAKFSLTASVKAP
ncbi:response regulator [Arsukibacterium ikkense]|nr:response regulator [Arsukibacterium ikkense]